MRVLHLVPAVGPGSGGMGVVAIEMARRQRSAGVDAELWCADPPAVAARVGPSEWLVALPVVGPRRFALSPLGERRARRTPMDVVHQHGLWTAQSRITEQYRRRGLPTVIAPHGSLEPGALTYSWWKKRLALVAFEARNLHQASCLQATSESELMALRQFGLRGPIAIVPNGVGEDLLESTGDGPAFRDRHHIPADRRIMLFLSRVHAKKGLALLVAALARHPEAFRTWTVVIAGSDENGHRQEIEQQARQAGVADVIRFVGPVYAEEKRAAFAAADLFVLPTRSENFGLVVAEALACQVPVVTTHGAPWADLLEHACGWWVPVDIDALATALVDAVSRNPDERRRMGARGQRLVHEKYSWDGANARAMAVYRWLCGTADRPSFVVVD